MGDLGQNSAVQFSLGRADLLHISGDLCMYSPPSISAFHFYEVNVFCNFIRDLDTLRMRANSAGVFRPRSA